MQDEPFRREGDAVSEYVGTDVEMVSDKYVSSKPFTNEALYYMHAFISSFLSFHCMYVCSCCRVTKLQ